MPTHQCLRTDDGEDVQQRQKPSVELDEKPTVGVPQPGTTLHLAPQNNQLLSERRVLGLKRLLDLNGEISMVSTKEISAIMPPG